MKRERIVVILAALAVAVVLDPASPGGDAGADGPMWPQYRGADRDGVASADGVGTGWPEGGPAVAWRLPIGPAFSQLVVRGEAVFTGTSDAEMDYLVRLDARSGKEVWRTPLGGVFVSDMGNGPRATPTVHEDRVYLLGGKGTLVAARTNDGKPVWSVDLTERFGAEVPRFGYSGSPLVIDDIVVIEVGAKEEGWLAALDRNTGETRWTVLTGPAGYSSPIVTMLGGTRQIVVVRGKTLTSMDLTGNVLWTFELDEGAVAMPVSLGDDRVFVSASGDTGCAMLRVKKGEGGFEPEVLWKNRNMRNHFNSSIFHDGHIYGFDNATLKCVSVETGDLMWAKRGFGKGSVMLSGDRLFVLSDKGKLAVVSATPDGYRESGSLQALEGKSWTAPSLAGGRLYLRNLEEMTCLDVRG
jgi:outer membrane protein assembly factor BamB